MKRNIFKLFMDKSGLSDRRCAHCHEPFIPCAITENSPASTARLCVQCARLLEPYKGVRCKKCGLPTMSRGELTCENCESSDINWKTVSYHGQYRGALRDLVLRLKFDGELAVANLFADFLLQATQCLPIPDCLVPIPQFPDKLRARGYNQANEIASAFAAMTKLPLENRLFARVKAGLPQEALNARERQENLKDAFKAKKLSGETIWLLDDVMTTGSTNIAATNSLIEAGAAAVHVVVVARTFL